MTLENKIVFLYEQVSPTLVLIFLTVATIRTTEVI
jgi:hypothetical protein